MWFVIKHLLERETESGRKTRARVSAKYSRKLPFCAVFKVVQTHYKLNHLFGTLKCEMESRRGLWLTGLAGGADGFPSDRGNESVLCCKRIKRLKWSCCIIIIWEVGLEGWGNAAAWGVWKYEYVNIPTGCAQLARVEFPRQLLKPSKDASNIIYKFLPVFFNILAQNKAQKLLWSFASSKLLISRYIPSGSAGPVASPTSFQPYSLEPSPYKRSGFHYELGISWWCFYPRVSGASDEQTARFKDSGGKVFHFCFRFAVICWEKYDQSVAVPQLVEIGAQSCGSARHKTSVFPPSEAFSFSIF